MIARRFATPTAIGALVGVLFFASNASAKTTVIDDFEGAGAPAPWTFTNGPEFPGAKGSLSKGAGHVGGGAHLSYDFTGGGAYVAAVLALSKPIDAVEIDFWVKAPPAIRVVLRVVDATGQTLQYSAARPLPALDATAWFRLGIDLQGARGHWGGANDGVVHLPIGGLAILAGDALEAKQVGAIDFDDVSANDALGQTIDLFAPIFPAPAGAADLSSRLGVNIHFFKDDKALDLAKGLGFSRVRMDFSWFDVEKTRGVYDFSFLDTLVDSLAARGMTLHLILDYGNGNYPPTGDAAFVSTTVPAFAACAKATAAHFAGKNVTYEVWNEANIKQFWPPAPDPAQYAALAKATIAAVHEGDAKAKVSTTGTSAFDFPFVRATIVGGGATGADAIGVHPYRATWPETLTDELVLLRSIADALPGAPPVWDTEWGYSSAWYGGGHDPGNRALQARMVAREMLAGWAVGFPLVVDYDLRDDGTNPTDGEHNFGLLANDYTDKPSGAAVRTLSTIAKGRSFVGFLDLTPTTLHAMRLDDAKSSVLAIWAESPNAKIPVTLPKGAKGVGMLGNPLDLSSGTLLVSTDDGPSYVQIDKPPSADAGVDGGADASIDADAAIDSTIAPEVDVGPDSSNGNASTGSSSGCGCTTAGGSTDASWAIASAIVALLAVSRARKSRAGAGP